MTTDRYATMFERLGRGSDVAFIPFVTLGDPSPDASARILQALVTAGADALELGLPFSDPVADGPMIQQAAVRSLASGTTIADCWRLIRDIRATNPTIPIGLLVYANLVTRRGIERFYQEAADAGVDSVLIADVPTDEAAPFTEAARQHGISPVLIAPPTAGDARLATIARTSRGYTYVTTRAGVTGEDRQDLDDLSQRLGAIDAAGGPPAVLGFGISTMTQVRAAGRAGAAGVISGSAVVRRIADHLDDESAAIASVAQFVAEMKRAGRGIARSARAREN